MKIGRDCLVEDEEENPKVWEFLFWMILER